MAWPLVGHDRVKMNLWEKFELTIIQDFMKKFPIIIDSFGDEPFFSI